MDLFNPFLIKKYESLLKKNPYSKIFCPLAQIYRSRKELKKAQEICKKGLQSNPSYFMGYIVQAQIYKDQGRFKESLGSLHQAKALSPDNVKTYQLYGEIYMEQKDIERTLSAFKMILFLRPSDAFAKKVVEQLEDALSKEVITKNSEEPMSPTRAIKKEKQIGKLQNIMAHIEKQDHPT